MKKHDVKVKGFAAFESVAAHTSDMQIVMILSICVCGFLSDMARNYTECNLDCMHCVPKCCVSLMGIFSDAE